MFDPVTFIIGIASSVMTNVVTELITGERDQTQKAEIEKEIEKEVAQHLSFPPLGQDDVDVSTTEEELKMQSLKLKIMDEIEIIAGRFSEVEYFPEKIRLKKRVRKPLLENQDKFTHKKLFSALQKLDRVIAVRREEFKPVNQIDSSEARESTHESIQEKKDSEANSLVWRLVSPSQPKTSKWERKVIDMEAKIRHRRWGEDSLNE